MSGVEDIVTPTFYKGKGKNVKKAVKRKSQ